MTAISGRFLSQTWRTNGAISPTKIIYFEKWARTITSRPLFLSLLLKSQLSRLIYYQIDIWKTPWIDYKQHLPSFCRFIMELIWNIFRRCRDRNFRLNSQPNVKNLRSYFGYKNNLYGKRNICYLTGSPVSENIWSSSKVNDLIGLLIWFSWPGCLLLARHNAMLAIDKLTHMLVLHWL